MSAQPSAGEVQPAWEAIAATQKSARLDGYYVTQPDHGQLAGEFAAALDSVKVCYLGESVVQAIAMHDIGWMPWDGELKSAKPPAARESGAVRTFANTEPEIFLRAWTGSIQAAQSTGPLGGLLVSAHFARLTHPYLASGSGSPEQRAQVEGFLHREAARVDRLLPQAGRSVEEIEQLVNTLALCDLASLYLCTNPSEAIEFPMEMHGQRVTMSFEDGAYRMRPNLLDHVLVLEIPCVRWVDGRCERAIVPVKVQ